MTISRIVRQLFICKFYLLSINCVDRKVFLSTEPRKVQMALDNVLLFTTGCCCIPPLGFESSPIINFFLPLA